MCRVFLHAEERFQRDIGGTLHANKNRVARIGSQLRCQRRADKGFAFRGTFHADLMKLPEPVIYSIDTNIAGPAIARLKTCDALRHYERTDAAEILRKARIGP